MSTKFERVCFENGSSNGVAKKFAKCIKFCRNNGNIILVPKVSIELSQAMSTVSLEPTSDDFNSLSQEACDSKIHLEKESLNENVEKKHTENKGVHIINNKISTEVARPTKKNKLDVELTEIENVFTEVDEKCEIKADLVVSLEKIDCIETKSQNKLDNINELNKSPTRQSIQSYEKTENNDTKIKTKLEKSIDPDKSPLNEKNQFENNEIKSPIVPDKSPPQEKTSDSDKSTTNYKEGSISKDGGQAKDTTQVRSSARVNKRKLEQEQDRRIILGNSPPYFKLDEDSLLTDQSSVPFDQVLGSVISMNHNDDSRGSQVRTSARVIKKMRLEAVAPSTSKSEVPEKKDKKDDQKPESKQKAVRPWTHEEKIMFFEAVSEFGKDFENIHSFIHPKLKKRGIPDDQNKTKDQVRQFYYKIFHEVFRHVKFSDKIKKVVQELYGIINYGELYKKLGTLTEKSCVKLTEMIYRGSTVIKYKGRTLRVKTPMCRALRKLNQLDDNYEELKLPNRVTVEVRPKDMMAFFRVQGFAQNPRLKTALPLQKRLSSVLACLNKRWKTVDAVNYEKAVISANPLTNDLLPSSDQISEQKDIFCPPLRLSPPPDAKIELPSINLSEYLTRQTICLTAFEARLGLDTYADLLLKKKTLKQKADVEQKCDVIIDKEGSSKEDNEINSSSEADAGDGHLLDIVDNAVNTILLLQPKLDKQDSEASESEDVVQPVISFHKEVKREVKDEKNVVVLDPESLEKIAKIGKGWTDTDCNSLTIGELYLMYGADSKLVLEYSWDTREESKKEINTSTHFLERWSGFFDDYADEHSQLSHSLSKLLSLAKLNYRRNIVKCLCGHMCSNKPSQNMRNTSSMAGTSNPRVRKMSSETYVKCENVTSDLPEQENTFQDNEMINFARTPMYIQPNHQAYPVSTTSMQLQLNSLQKLNTKYTNRKGRRPRSKQVVVERKLPLLPNNMESGHQIVRMNIISQEPIPEVPALEKVVGQLDEVDVVDEPPDTCTPTLKNDLIDRVGGSPPCVSDSANTSPSRILKEGEWINSDVADYSLSSLLGHLESPGKTPSASNMAADLSTQVNAHLQSLLTQSSVDFAASFAELARVTCEPLNEGSETAVEEG